MLLEAALAKRVIVAAHAERNANLSRANVNCPHDSTGLERYSIYSRCKCLSRL